MLATSVLLAAALAAAPDARTDAASGSLAVLAVADAPGPSAELAGLARKVQESLGSRGGAVLAPDEIRRRMSGRATSATLSELDRAYLGAVAAQRAGDLPGAAKTLRAVLEDLERLPETDGTATPWSQALLRLAYVEVALGYRAEGRELVGRLLRADAAARPDPELFPPSFVKQVDEVRAQLRKAPRRNLTVTTGGRPARVYVEGRDVGAAPVTIPLAAGTYRVSAAAGASLVRAGAVELDAEDRTVAIDVGLAEAFRPDAPGLAVADAGRAAAVVSAGATLRAERVLAISSVVDRDVRYLVAALHDVGRGQLAREGRIRLTDWTPADGAVAALTDFVVTGGAPSGHVIVKPEPRPDLAVRPAAEKAAPLKPSAPASAAAPGGSKVLGWVAIGTAALAVGAGAFAGYEALAGSGKYDDAKAMVGADGKLLPGSDPAAYNRNVRDGDAAVNAARVSGAAAVGLAGTSAVLGWISYKRTGEIGPIRF